MASASTSGSTSDELGEWRSFFDEVAGFLQGIDRQYGVANESFTQYAIERLELVIQSCAVIRDRLTAATTESLGEDDRSIVSEYQAAMQDFIGELQRILLQWHKYQAVLDSSDSYVLSYRAVSTQSGRRNRGRPRFDVSIEQLQYLKSLSFTWSEIAALLCVSRMTLYRYSGMTVI